MTSAFESVCQKTLRNLDAFIDRELEQGAAAAIRNHLDGCAACSRELEVRSELRGRLRRAVHEPQPSPFLETRILANLRQQEQRPSRWLQRSMWASAAAALLVALVAVPVAYELGHLRFSVTSQNQYIDTLLHNVSRVMAPGLSNHVHCAVFRKYAKKAPAIETLRTDLAPEYRPLLDAVRASVPSNYSVHMAHECSFRGRRFIHFALKSDSSLVSLVLTRKQAGETLAENGIKPAISQGGLNLYGASAQRFQLSGFETSQHLAYLVTELSPAETQRMMLALAPQVTALLAKLPA